MIKISPLSAISLITIAVLVVMLWGKSCKINKLEAQLAKCQQADKPKIIHDTATIFIPEQAAIASTLTQTNSVKPTKQRIDSFIQFETIVDTTDLSKLKQAYVELANLYNEKNEYVDTSLFKNGIAITNTTVYQNRIEEQKTKLDSIRQEIIHDIIYRNVYKQRNQLMLGIETIWGKRFDSSAMLGGTIMFKFKNGFGIEYGRYVDFHGNQSNKAGVKKTISFKKP